jgi:hypothetical protein
MCGRVVEPVLVAHVAADIEIPIIGRDGEALVRGGKSNVVDRTHVIDSTESAVSGRERPAR